MKNKLEHLAVLVMVIIALIIFVVCYVGFQNILGGL